MFDHVVFGVSNYAQCKAFFAKTLDNMAPADLAGAVRVME